MGLRLYQPPADSDVPSKPDAEKTAAVARSVIRRSRVYYPRQNARRFNPEDFAEFTLPAHRESILLRADNNQATLSPGAALPQDDTPRPPQIRPRLRLPAPDQRQQPSHRIGLGPRDVFISGPYTNPGNQAAEPVAPFAATAAIDRYDGPPSEPYEMSNLRSTQQNSRSGNPHAPQELENHAPAVPSAPSTGPHTVRPISLANRIALPRLAWRSPEFSMGGHTGHDGLGDRNRSLSPEDDNVWDTLLRTITPDPQPPSVGSSFASVATSSSNQQSRTSATESAASSIARATSEEDSGLEPPCDLDRDNSDTEGDEFEDELRRLSGLLVPRRSLGQRANNIDQIGLDAEGGLQRIIQHLARREDIPDEWWAEVGLSRNFTRETS